MITIQYNIIDLGLVWSEGRSRSCRSYSTPFSRAYSCWPLGCQEFAQQRMFFALLLTSGCAGVAAASVVGQTLGWAPHYWKEKKYAKTKIPDPDPGKKSGYSRLWIYNTNIITDRREGGGAEHAGNTTLRQEGKVPFSVMYISYLRSDKVPVFVLMINHFPYHIEICQCRGFGLVRFRIDLEFPDIFFLPSS